MTCIARLAPVVYPGDCYGAFLRKFGADHYLRTQPLRFFSHLNIPTPTPAKTPAAVATPTTPTPASRASSEPPSDKEEAGRTAHIIYLDPEQKKMAAAQIIPRKGSGGSDVILLREDWASSLFPAYSKPGITPWPTHIDMYHSNRGAVICYRWGCAAAVSAGPDGGAYCPKHIMTAAAIPLR